MSWSIRDKVVLVTGGNAGIGRFTALELARRGAKVRISVRDEEKGEESVDWLRCKSEGGDVKYYVADFASLDQVRVLAEELLRNGPLHVLINNAGLILGDRQESADGFEMTFAVNHLAPFLLTRLLLVRLLDCAPARVVNVASRAHARASLDFDDLQNARAYSSMQVYSQSKLANILFTRELARRLDGREVSANCLHPGVVRTRIGADGDLGGPLALVWSLAKLFFISPERGAATSVYLACEESLQRTSGEYFDDCKPARSSRRSQDMAAAARLWRLSSDLCGLPPDL